jgi:phage FluMu gp28-like protein
VQTCFEASDFPVLTQDFRKIHRKWIGPNVTTFDAERDGTGHADTFWGAVFAHSVARVQQRTPPPKREAPMPTMPQDYVGLL